MQILINNETLDLTLEKEKNLGEVYDSLCSWLKGGGLYPLNLHIDSHEYDVTQRSHWNERLIDDVNRFDLRAGSINELHQQQMMTIIDYLLLLRELIAGIQRGERVEKEFMTAFAEYDHIRPALAQIFRTREEDFAADFKLLDESAAEIRKTALKPQDLLIFNEKLEQLRSILLDRLHETAQPIQNMKNTAEILKNLFPALEEAGISLQTGNEREAYSLVLKISEITAKCVRIMEILSVEYPQNPFTELSASVKGLCAIIAEMNEAMKNKDLVMLADILEYDLHELLKTLVEQIFLLNVEAV